VVEHIAPEKKILFVPDKIWEVISDSGPVAIWKFGRETVAYTAFLTGHPSLVKNVNIPGQTFSFIRRAVVPQIRK
jgi:hypothetical protein